MTAAASAQAAIPATPPRRGLPGWSKRHAWQAIPRAYYTHVLYALTAPTVKIFEVLFHKASFDEGWVDERQDTLAKELHVSVVTLQDAIAEMVELGLIDKTKHGRTVRYRFRVDQFARVDRERKHRPRQAILAGPARKVDKKVENSLAAVEITIPPGESAEIPDEVAEIRNDTGVEITARVDGDTLCLERKDGRIEGEQIGVSQKGPTIEKSAVRPEIGKVCFVDQWEGAKAALKARISAEAYSNWVAGTAAVAERDGVLIVRCPNMYSADWLEQEYAGHVQAAISKYRAVMYEYPEVIEMPAPTVGAIDDFRAAIAARTQGFNGVLDDHLPRLRALMIGPGPPALIAQLDAKRNYLARRGPHTYGLLYAYATDAWRAHLAEHGLELAGELRIKGRQ